MTTDAAFPLNVLKGDLLRLVSIDLDTADSLGPITELWVDPRGHRVIGVGCGGGLGRRSHRVPWHQVVSIGHDGLVLRGATAPVSTPEDGPDCPGHEPEYAPENTLLADGIALGDVEVWSDHGDRLGHLSDYCFSPSDGAILQYHFSTTASPDLAPGLYAIPPAAVISLGRRRMMIAQVTLAQATRLGDPVSPRAAIPRSPLEALPLDQVRDHLPDPRQTWDATLDRTRQARTQLSDQWQEQGHRLQSEAQQRLGHWLGDVKKRTRRLRHQIRETVSDVTAGLPTPPQSPPKTPPPIIDVDATELWDDD